MEPVYACFRFVQVSSSFSMYVQLWFEVWISPFDNFFRVNRVSSTHNCGDYKSLTDQISIVYATPCWFPLLAIWHEMENEIQWKRKTSPTNPVIFVHYNSFFFSQYVVIHFVSLLLFLWKTKTSVLIFFWQHKKIAFWYLQELLQEKITTIFH